MADDYASQSHTLLVQVPATTFCILTPLVVAARFWSRHHTKSAFGSDDWTILGSMVFALADCSVLLTACSYGFGKHASTLTFYNKTTALQFFYCSQILYKISLNLTKFSILLLYMRAITIESFRIACRVLMIIVVSYGIAGTVATILQCSPLPRAWDKTIPGTCFNITAFWYANATYAIATDLILLLMPMRVVWGLQVRAIQKVALLIVFAMGGLVTVCSIVRMTTLAASSTSTDSTYDISSTCWANIEGNVAILCACLPMFRRPLAHLFPRLLSSLGNNTSVNGTAPGTRTFSHATMDKSDWEGNDSKRTSPAPASAAAAVGGAAPDWDSDELILEHIEVADVEAGDPRGGAERVPIKQAGYS